MAAERGEATRGPFRARTQASATETEASTLQLVAADALRGHAGAVKWGAWGAVGGRPILATGGDDGTVRLWDPVAGTPSGPPLTGHTSAVNWGAWTAVDGRPILATGDLDDTVR